MARYTSTPVNTLQGINNELAKVELAMKDTLDRKGVTPNFLDTDLDMNSQRILNLPEPVYSQEPVRLGDVKPFIDETKAARDAAVGAAGVAQESAEASATSASSSEQSAASAANSAAKAKDLTEVTSALLTSQGISGEYGFFEEGFTYNESGDVGIDTEGNIWTYNGTMPFTVAAGTTPTSPTYTQVIYGAASQVSTKTYDTVQSFIDSFELKIFQSPTNGGLTEIQTRTVNGGDVYEVRKTSDNSLATVYSDAAGTAEIVQNGTANQSGSDGVVEFYVADGDYYVEVGGVKTGFIVGVSADYVSTSDGRSVQQRLNDLPSEVDAAGTAATLISQHNSDATAHPELSAFITSEAARAETAAEVAMTAGWVYEDVASGEAARTDGEYFWVVSADDAEVLELWLMGATTATDTTKRTPSTALFYYILSTSGKNLINPDNFLRGYYYSNSSSGVVTSPSYICSDFIPVIEGETYTVSGIDEQMGVGYLSSPQLGAGNGVGIVNFSDNNGGAFTVPTGQGITHVVVNITNEGQSSTTYDNTAQIEVGSETTSYEPYKRLIPQSLVKDLESDISSLESDISSKVNKSEIIELVSHNLIDQSKIDYSNRYSEGSKGFTADNIGIAATDWIPVEEGEFYTISGEGVFRDGVPTVNIQGGYFTSYGASIAVQNIEDFSPVTGDGRVIQVPVGLGITHVVVSLQKLNSEPSATELSGDVQMEKGEVATAYQPYNPERKIIRSLILDDIGSGGSGGNVVFNSELWYKYTDGGEGNYQMDKLPNFREHWLKRDKDLCVVNTGTSLTARSDEHCTYHPQKEFRPPLMHSNNMASILWDKMKWDNQEYRRYDSVYFTENGGTFATASDLSEWDDNIYRRGLTRYSEDTGASVSFEVPVGAWQFNFIYRTDSVATEQAQVTVAEGNGQIEVFDETTESWVEANGYNFSMKEPTPVARNVSVPNPSTETFNTISIATKGNTTYQKRLKMRCKSSAIDSRASVKNVTIAGVTSGRFLYWGVEWSKREFMITYINAARGSHDTDALTIRGLPRFADNEVWSFKPDILFFELPIHNDGAGNANSYAGGIWERLTENYVFRSDYELSMLTRAANFGLSPEIGMFNSSISYNFGAIDESGNLILSEQDDGSMMTALDKYNQAYNYVVANHPDVVFINSVKRWVDAGYAIFGDLRTATEGSGKDGNTFTNEGSHWNDTGSKIIAKTLTPVFDFTSQ